jgi:hypothetical protein
MTKTTANRWPSDLRAALAALAIVATAATPVVAFAGATELPTTTVSVEPTYSPQRGYSCWTADSAVWAARCSRTMADNSAAASSGIQWPISSMTSNR